MKKDIYSIFNDIIVDDIESEPLNETEVNNIMKKISDKKAVKKTAGKNKRFILGTVAAAAAVAMIVPASVYAYNKAVSISKTAKYQNTVVLSANTESSSENSSESTTKNPWEIELMDYEFGWLPEGFDKPEHDVKYRNDPECITPVFYRLPDGKSTEIDLKFSENYETYESNGKTAMINYRISYGKSEEEGNFGREIWVSFDGTNYFLQLYLTDGISQEDTKKIIDNLKLVPTDEVRFGTYLPWEDKTTTANSNHTEHEVDMEKCEVYYVGDTISYPGVPEELSGYSVTLNSAEITDSFDGINTDGCGWEADYSEYMDENGNIAENTRSWIKRGDGVNTLDEVVKEESVPMHILKLNVTFTNIADKTNDICISPNLFQFIDGKPYTRWDFENESYKSHIDCVDSIRPGDFGGHFSLYADPDKKGGKNAVILEPGESADVQLAFFVADDEVDKMLVYFSMSGNTLSFSMENGGCPFFDLRK